MSTSYHGKKPVTTTDVKMARSHLSATRSLLASKIKDHQQAMQGARKVQNKASASYNQSHLVSHKKDLTQVNQSLKTLSRGMKSTLSAVSHNA